ncbi:MAG: amidohydrolase family protein, partial [Pollutimonas bauzanensis]
MDAHPARQLPQGAVDCHAHVMQKDAPLAAMRHSAPARDVSVQEYLRILDAHHVAFGVLTAPSFYGTDNSLLLAALGEASGRLRGTVTVDPGIAHGELLAMKEKGVCGVRLNWIKRPALPDISSAQYQRLFDLLRELDMHVEVFIESRLLGQVLPAIQRSKAKIVIDHFGNPEPEQGTDGEGFKRLLDAIHCGNTWVKLSAPYRLGGASIQPYVDQLLQGSG